MRGATGHPRAVGVAAAVALIAWTVTAADATGAAPAAEAPLKIGIIGAGHIGGTLASLWVKAGHEVLVSSRHPDQLKGLVSSLGPRARAGTPREAALFGDVVVISVPYGALPQIGRDLRAELSGKIVLDTGNPYPQRDGDMAVEARRKGTGVSSAEFLPGVRLVRAFNAINSGDLASEAHRCGLRTGARRAPCPRARVRCRDGGLHPPHDGGAAAAGTRTQVALGNRRRLTQERG
jgi:predicted dinucleotide-binding enzyme